MPNLPAHIDLALQAVERSGIKLGRAQKGYLLLGATAPDMRAITGRDREEYHFAPLDFTAPGTGVTALLWSNPHLRPDRLQGSDDVRAFMAGYISHLAMDEAWILHVFRPFFGDGSPFGDRATALVMDRALQLELDRRAQPAVAQGLPMMSALDGPPDVGFIPSADLERWRLWTVEFLGRGFSWERLRFMARRIARGRDGHKAYEVAEEFIADVRQGLDRVFRVVAEEDLERFWEKALAETGRWLEAYLA